LPSPQRLILQTIGIAATEADTGKSAFLAELRDSLAEQISDTEILYPNAFDSQSLYLIPQGG
jgi:hypothetical protein